MALDVEAEAPRLLDTCNYFASLGRDALTLEQVGPGVGKARVVTLRGQREMRPERAIRRADGLAADMGARLELLDRDAFGIAVQDAQELVFRELGSGDVAIAGR